MGRGASIPSGGAAAYPAKTVDWARPHRTIPAFSHAPAHRSPSTRKETRPRRLGKTLGIVGLGWVGKRTAFIGRLGFNMKTIACDLHVEPADAEMLGVQLVDLDALLREADVIAIYAVLIDETWGLKSSICLPRPGPWKRSGSPAPRSKCGRRSPPTPVPWVRSLLRSPRTSLSSHLGSVHEAMVMRHQAALENIARFCRGQRPR